MSTRLSAATIAELRKRATLAAGPFVDPVVFRRLQQWAPSSHPEWAAAILGRPFTGIRYVSNADLLLLDLAHTAEPDPPPSAALLAARAELQRTSAEQLERRWAALAAWQTTRAALPVRVDVVHNYTSARHTETHVQGVDHAIVREPLHVGRLHRDPGQTLCWSPSRAQHLVHFSDHYDDRIPDCRLCLRIIARLAPEGSR